MKPYLLVSGDFVKTGGMDRANYALAKHLAEQGRLVHLVAHRVADDLNMQNNVIWHRVPKPLNSYFIGASLLQRTGRSFASSISADGGSVVVNGGNCPWPGVNWVHYIHAMYRPENRTTQFSRLKGFISHRAFLAKESHSLRQARIVIANSQRTRLDLLERFGLSEERVRTVYYGIDPDIFRPSTQEERDKARLKVGAIDSGRPLVAFVGALGDRRKGFDILLAAWELLSDEPLWDADLIVIGYGAELPYWQARVQKAKLKHRIKFLGFSPDVAKVLAACDALVHPARYEAYGLAVHEALCLGLPAIVSAHAGVAERFPRELQGLLIPDPERPSDVASRLLYWRQNRETIRAAVAPLSENLRRRTWDAMAAEIVGCLDAAA